MGFFIFFLIFIFGCLIGSFLNVVVLRLPLGEKLTGRSHCPNCKRILSAFELVPLFSYLFLGGKCRTCHLKISPRYFFIEMLTGLLFVLAAVHIFPDTTIHFVSLVKLCLILSVLLAVFIIDFEYFLILDQVLLVGGVGVVLLSIIIDALGGSFARGVTLPSLAMAVICPIPFFLVWFVSKGKWMGFGDVKLAGFLGLALGWPQVWVGVLLGVFLGGISGIILLVSGKKDLKSQVPFGTFLSVGSALALFFGPWLLHWYLGLLGFIA